MARKKKITAAKTQDLLAETLEGLMRQRLLQLGSQKEVIQTTKIRPLKLAKKTPATYAKFVRNVKDIDNEVKSLRRGLGALIMTDPEFYGPLLEDLASMPVNRAFADKWKAFHGKLADYSRTHKGLVGHHPVALSILRDAMIAVPKWARNEFRKLASAEGFKLGDEFLDYITPGAHKRFATHITGELANRGVTKEHTKLLEALVERSAHSRFFGGEGGLSFPIELANKATNPDDLYRLAKPYLDLANEGAKAGQDLNKLILSNSWKTPADLLKQVEKLPLPDTAGIIQRMTDNFMDEGLISRETGKWIGEFKPSTLVVQPGAMTKGQQANWGGQIMYSKADEVAGAVKPVGGGAAALTNDAIFQQEYNALNKQGRTLVDNLVEAKNTAQLKQYAIAGSRAAMVNPLMFGASTALGAVALKAREAEVAANPDDPWLQFQLKLDRVALGADATGLATSTAALTGWGALAPAAAEITSNVASGASLAIDFTRWVKDPEAREQTMDWWKDVYARGSRGLLKAATSAF